MSEVNKKTILIVDDSSVIREMIKDFLNDRFDILEAAEPKECLETLTATTPRIDLGLIDVEMPEMTGFQLVKAIKQYSSYADVPFIMVTSRDGKEDVDKAVLAGACDYITKPFDDEMLLEKIEKHLKGEQEDLKKIIKEHVHSIKKNILFQNLPLNGLIKFLMTCRQNRYKAGDVLFSGGEPSKSMAIVLEGCVSISKDGSKVCDLQPPALIGEIGFFTEEQRNSDVRAVDDVLSLAITQNDLNTFIQREPGVSITLYRNIVFCLRNKISNDNRHIMSLQEEISKLKTCLKEKELPGNDELYIEEKEDSFSPESEDLSRDRKHIRVAISNRNICHVKIEDETYDVKDLSIGGINIETKENCWIDGDILMGDLIFKDEPIFQFNGTVKSFDGDTCGVQFNRVPLNLESAIIKTVNFLQRLGAVI